MALVVLFMMLAFASGTDTSGEMALANVTRSVNGDLFSLVGTDCGLTRCMEVSHGTALAALGGAGGCVCQCRRETPAFREDHRTCVNNVDECPMASFGRGATKPQIPFVFLPLKGQIIYPSKEIIFTDVEDAICAVTSAQYLSPSGWVTLRDLVDNDVPFGLYRDEGSTYLQWRGSPSLHSRLEGRLVTVHVLCSAPKPAHLAASCAAFRIAGITRQTLLDVRSIPFHAGETVTTEPAAQSQGLSVLESLAIGVCVLMIVFVYAAGIIFYIHYKQKQRRKSKDPELNHSHTTSTDNESTMDSRLGMDSMRMKTNPLMNLENARNDYTTDAGLSDVSEHTEDTFDSTSVKTQQFQDRNSNVVSAVIHSRRKKPPRPSIRATSTVRVNERIQRRSASPEIEKAPHSDLSILHCSIDNHDESENLPSPPEGEPVIRRKLYFNPVFFEIEHLKSPPPAAVDFLTKLREVMTIAKEKMISKRFIPILSDIPEEESYHTVDLGWDIPCARRGRRFSAISLKRENSRRTVVCGGCPGCNSHERAKKNTSLIRSNSCKTCVSDDYKQKIVQKWLDEVPTPTTSTRPVKSIAKVSGTPRVIEPKEKEEVRINLIEPVHTEAQESVRITESILTKYINEVNLKIEDNLENQMIRGHKKSQNTIVLSTASNSLERKSPSNYATRLVRKKLPPPPPPPIEFSDLSENKEPVYPEVKIKMQAVIHELNKCRRVEPDELYDILKSPIVPRLVIPVVAADSIYFNDSKGLFEHQKLTDVTENINNGQLDSLERKVNKKRRFSLDYAVQPNKKEIPSVQNTKITRDRRTQSWRDFKNSSSLNTQQTITYKCDSRKKYNTTNDIFINSVEPIYNNIENHGPLTIEVRGSPVDSRQKVNDDFDPDTLDRKPKKSIEETESKKSVEKILFQSSGSFKCKLIEPEPQRERSPPDETFTRKIGSLREIYEARTKAQNDVRFYARRGSVPNGTQELAAYVKYLERPRNLHSPFELKPPVPPKQKRAELYTKGNTPRSSPPSDLYHSSEERDRFPQHSKSDERRSDINARRSGRRSARTRPRRVDIRKLCRTEDSGYLSTDSNESKRRARYLLQFKPKLLPPEPILKMPTNKINNLHIDTDTDDLESLCDGRSESGGESVETDSVFFGNFNDSKQIFEELGYGRRNKIGRSQEQIDSGFAGETNIILSGDSDSEHKSVISIVTGHDARISAASISNLDDSPYIQSVEC